MWMIVLRGEAKAQLRAAIRCLASIAGALGLGGLTGEHQEPTDWAIWHAASPRNACRVVAKTKVCDAPFCCRAGYSRARPSIVRKWLEEGGSWLSRVDQVEDEPT